MVLKAYDQYFNYDHLIRIKRDNAEIRLTYYFNGNFSFYVDYPDIATLNNKLIEIKDNQQTNSLIDLIP